MNKTLFLLSVALLGILQATVLDRFKFCWVKPDLLLASAVISSLSLEARWALITALLAGFLKDASGVYLFGINTFLFPIWSFLIIRLSKEISIEDNYIPVAIVFIVVLLNNIIMRLAFLTLGNPLISIGVFLRVSFIEAIYTALLFPLLFKALKAVLHYKR